MNYYCCVHSQETIDEHKHYAINHDFPDKNIPYKFICGTKIDKSAFKDQIVDAYIGNPLNKFNRQLRQNTSLMFLLNNDAEKEFMFTSCSVFVVKPSELQIPDGTDLSVMSLDSNWENPYHVNKDGKIAMLPWIQQDIDQLLGKASKNEIQDFYYKNFNGLDLFGQNNRRMLYWKCYINNKNTYIKKMFSDMIMPFTFEDNIKFYASNLTPLILSHLYYSKYQSKIKLAKTFIDSNLSYYDRNIDKNGIIHYYGG